MIVLVAGFDKVLHSRPSTGSRHWAKQMGPKGGPFVKFSPYHE